MILWDYCERYWVRLPDIVFFYSTNLVKGGFVQSKANDQ
ncbi:hypothetical protein RV15_GL002660 [Enterococcus silesiacus]|uniref:Uncharacterized protein n=1 Tax=Enterococcus silesiacus TaxID=332949 RepID=A0AA91GG39_9ENTE|nr:hypothetical protein RV15_GL002660 [Enterococcus silesiacus]